MITVCTLFRDSQEWYGHKINQIDRFFSNLKNQTINDYRIVCLTGDSVDNTTAAIYTARYDYNISTTIIEHNTQHKFYGSVVNNDRIINLANIANKVLAAAYEENPEYILWIESDLIFPTNLLEKLLECFKQKENTIGVAPLIFKGNRFYDTWAFRQGGRNWMPNKFRLANSKKARHAHLQTPQYIEMDSVGSCCLFKGFPRANFGSEAFPELCRQLREHGTIYADSTIAIEHPNTKCIHNRWI